MADISLFKRLKRMFSTNVILTNVGGKLKVTDTSRIQGTGEMITNFMKGQKFGGFHSTAGRYGYNELSTVTMQRHTLFRDYELMEQDPIIASALDIYSDECTTTDEFGDILTIKSDNDKVKETLENLFLDILNVDFNLWSWIRNMTKYGDHFLKLEIAEKYGIVNVIPLSPYEMVREEGFNQDNPFEIKFRQEGLSSTITEFENYEIAHFRLVGDSNYLPYGKSMIELARRTWKQLILMEDAMLIHRIMRAPEKRVFKVDVGNIPPNEVEQYMKSVVGKIKKVPYIDPRTGDYNLKYNMMNITEDFFLPVRGGDSGTNIESLGGLEYQAIDDIEYLKHKMMAALKIPKAFLGYEEGLAGKATLAAEDVRFSKTIQRIQKIVVSELTKIAILHLYIQGFDESEMVNFELTLTNPSTIAEQEKIALWSEKTNLMRDMKELRMVSDDWLYKNIMNFSDDEIEEERKKVLDDVKRAFRHEQIANEGNDPFVTGQTFGTKHDIEMMKKGISSEKDIDYGETNFRFPSTYKMKNSNDEKDYHKEYNDERREEPEASYNTDSHVRGRDVLGMQDLKGSRKIHYNSKKSNKSLITQEDFEKLKDIFNIKTKQIIKESLRLSSESDINIENDDSEGNFLDENNLLDLEK